MARLAACSKNLVAAAETTHLAKVPSFTFRIAMDPGSTAATLFDAILPQRLGLRFLEGYLICVGFLFF